MRKNIRGFTIVELLIVIVVVAILAAISIVAYNGIQQRANNTAIISAVGQTIKSIQVYRAQEGEYPLTGTYACITTTTGCVEGSGTVRNANTTFDNNIASVASVSRSVPNYGTAGYGIIYHHAVDRLFNGESRPALLFYFLQGQGQNCGATDVMTAWGTPGQTASSSSTGYTSSSSTTNKTTCLVSLQ